MSRTDDSGEKYQSNGPEKDRSPFALIASAVPQNHPNEMHWAKYLWLRSSCISCIYFVSCDTYKSLVLVGNYRFDSISKCKSFC